MIIPKAFGGLAFSAYAQSEVVRTIASRSTVTAATVMVPNSLGPGELLIQYGTEAQQKHWLPRLADGRDIPCFGLTSAEAGSDAAAMTDTGVVCEAEYDGEQRLGIRLNWRKRYITLAPVATLLGLAFRLHDPDNRLGRGTDLGITLALVPTDRPGIRMGRRHLPCAQRFQNGPTEGRDVFIPLDHVIGAEAQVGQGWKMLMAALAAGRGLSLPSLSAGMTALAARTSGAYAQVRRQFGIPIGKMEGVQRRLGSLAATAYELDAARALTCTAVERTGKPAVIAAMMKSEATERARASVSDAMDIHASKAIMDGPRNPLGNLYRTLPLGITVEGANLLTRNLILFGQGAIRCHPHLLDEMLALETADQREALAGFDRAFWAHLGHALATLWRAWTRSWSGGRTGPVPADVPSVLRADYRQLGRYAAGFALLSELVLLTLGGQLMRKEMLSARLGDIFCKLYFLSAVLKRWEDNGCPPADRVLVDACLADGYRLIERRIDGVLRNLPARPAAWLARVLLLPRGPRQRGPSDETWRACANALLDDSEQRDRLTAGLYPGAEGDPITTLEQAFRAALASAPLEKRMCHADLAEPDAAVRAGVLSETEAETVKEARALAAEVIAVDDFDAEELTERTAR